MTILENCKTLESKQVWSSPDGQRKIYEIIFEQNGTKIKASTYSEKIIEVGWTGNLESYEKNDRIFVRQHREDQGGYKGAIRPSSDPFTMYMSYSKDITIAMIDGLAPTAKAQLVFTDLIDQTIDGAYRLYEARPDAPKEAETQELSLDA